MDVIRRGLRTVSRKDRLFLIDMYNKAIDVDFVLKNIPMQVNTVVNKDSNSEEPRVLALEETDIFMEAAQYYRYFNTLISEMSKFEAEESKKGVNCRIGSQKFLHQLV